MKNVFTALVILMAMNASAQYTFFEPKGSYAIEVSLDNSPLKRLPIYRNAISSLAVVGDWIVGGTSAEKGLSPFLFTASLSKKELTAAKDLSTVLTGQQKIASGFCVATGGILYAGTIAEGEQQDGHLISVQITDTGIGTVKDLGVPVKGEGIFSLTLDEKTGMLYGISYPTGIFFSFDIRSGIAKSFKDLVPAPGTLHKLEDEFGLRPDDYLCKALVSDNSGRVYGSTPINRIFYFDPKDQKFHYLKDSLPEVWGRNVLGQVESWAKAKDGKLYGGNAGDGQLFVIDPATQQIRNLGKPVMVNRLRGLAFGRNGKLYGIAGALPGYSHLFSYSPLEGFRDYGNPQFKMVAPGIEQGIDWRGFQLGTLVSSPDGKYIVMGEDEALSQLMVFPVD